MDVNLLPDELKKREEEELRRKDGRLIEVPMSTPIKDPSPSARHLAASSGNAPPAKESDKQLPRLHEESYIHRVTPEGKLVHGDKPIDQLSRSRVPWWKRLLRLFRPKIPKVLRVPAPPTPASVKPAIPPLSTPLPPPAPVKEIKPAPSPVLERASGIAIEKKIESLALPLSVPPAKQPSPLPTPEKEAIVKPPIPAPATSAAPFLKKDAGASVSAKPLKSDDTKVAASPLGPPSFGINLLPPEWAWSLTVTLKFRRKVLLALLVIFAVSLIGSMGGSYWYTSYQRKRLEQITLDRQKIEADIENFRPQEVVWSDLNNRLKLIAALLRKHTMATYVFKFLEETVSPVVQYTSVDFNTTGIVTVTAETVSYEDMARQVVALRADQKRVNQVDITSFAFAENKQIVTFNLSISLKPEVWQYGQF